VVAEGRRGKDDRKPLSWLGGSGIGARGALINVRREVQYGKEKECRGKEIIARHEPMGKQRKARGRLWEAH
jgi:hypothetical protein